MGTGGGRSQISAAGAQAGINGGGAILPNGSGGSGAITVATAAAAAGGSGSGGQIMIEY
jgi:hypothetical protein